MRLGWLLSVACLSAGLMPPVAGAAPAAGGVQPVQSTPSGRSSRNQTATHLIGGISVSTPAAERRLQQAASRLDGLEQLQQTTARAQTDLRLLARASRDLQNRAAQAVAAQESATLAIEGLPGCQRDADAAAQRWSEQTVVARTAQATSRSTVQAVAVADAGALVASARRADGGFAARATAEQALARSTSQLVAQRTTCARLAVRASAASNAADAQVLALRRDADGLSGSVEAVRAAWTLAGRQADIARRRGWLPAAGGPAADLRNRGAVDALKAAAGAAPVRNTTLAFSAAFPVPLGLPPAAFVVQNLQRRATLDDAAAMLRSLAEGCPGSATPGCDGLQPQQDAIAHDIRSIDAQIAEQQRALLVGNDAASAEMQRLRASADARHTWLAAIERQQPSALAEADAIAAQAQQAATALQARVDPAVESAERTLADAFLVARGRPMTGRGATAAPGMGLPPPPPPPSPPPMALLPSTPQLAGHAYEFIPAWDTERKGFGAYTYVLLRSASDLRKPEVLQRWRTLLEVVLRERAGAAVPAAEAPFVNLFCIPGERPVSFTGDPDRIAAAFDSELALTLMFRAQSGLLTRPEIKRRLQASNGPFLITLPVRIADARSDTPLLFADLGAFPVDAVADLATHYKGALLADFPTQQLAWKPPVAQRVALVMIGLASDLGGLFTSVLPSAVAGER